MKKLQRMAIGNSIRYELRKGEHTFTMCICERHGCRSGLCWECLLEKLEYNQPCSISTETEEKE